MPDRQQPHDEPTDLQPTDLDTRLLAARTELLGEIMVPELHGVRSRARVIRRRRRFAMSASALALAGVAALGGTAVDQYVDGRPQPQATPPAVVPVWQGGGLTLHGLDDTVFDLAGTVMDVEFADSETGFALAAECGGGECTIALAASRDGGRTWQPWPSPVTQAAQERLPRLIAAGDGVALVGDATWFARHGDPQWTPYDRSAAPTVEAVPAGARLWLDTVQAHHECVPGAVMAWLPDGTPTRLTSQPGLEVCRVAPGPTPEGAWWVAGRLNGQAAVAVTRDGGRTWSQPATFPDGGDNAWAQVVTLGSIAYATVVTPTPRRSGELVRRTLSIRAVYRAGGDGIFQPYAGDIGIAVGDVAPLLDGRLLAAGPHWYAAEPAADQLSPVGGSLPWVARLQRTPGGWVAYDLFEAGWVAVSPDGITWEKLNLR